MRSRTNSRPELSSELRRSLAPELAAALSGVYEAFDRLAPLDVAYCRCPSCFPGDEVLQLLKSPYRDLTCHDLYPILSAAYQLWGNWPDLAYFVPRLLECYFCEQAWYEHEDDLLRRLLQASRPDAAFWENPRGQSGVGPPMRAEERRSISRFLQAYLIEAVGVSAGPATICNPPSGKWLSELVGFLSAFDEPLEPVLVRWRECERPDARVSYALLLAELILQQWPERRAFTNYLNRNLTALPENEAFFVEQLRPKRVAEYLAASSSGICLLEPEERLKIDLAFDWMAALA